DQSFFDEDFPKKIYSNPLFDEEIIPMKIDPHPLNVESDLIESKLNRDSSIIISSKSDSLFDEFVGELVLLKSIPPGIDETDCHREEDTYFTKRLLSVLSIDYHRALSGRLKNFKALEDDRMKEYQNGMTHFHGVEGNNCQAILQRLEYPFQSHGHLPQCSVALGHPD
nr:hypothetical protein [Tanacetum cinerariifolium]